MSSNLQQRMSLFMRTSYKVSKQYTPSLFLIFVCEGQIYDDKRKHLEEVYDYSKQNDIICLEMKNKVLFMGQSRVVYVINDTEDATREELQECGVTDFEEKDGDGSIANFKHIAEDVVPKALLPVYVFTGERIPVEDDETDEVIPKVEISKNKISVITEAAHRGNQHVPCLIADIENKDILDSGICVEIIRNETKKKPEDRDISRCEQYAAYLLVSGKWYLTEEEWPMDVDFTGTTLNAICNHKVDGATIRSQLYPYLDKDLLSEVTDLESVPREIIFYAMLLHNLYTGAEQLAHMGYLRIKHILVGCRLLVNKYCREYASKSEYEKVQKLSGCLTEDAIAILEKVKHKSNLNDQENYDAKLLLNEGCLRVAIQTKNNTFIQDDITKKTINKIWYGREDPNSQALLLLLLTILHPILLPLLMVNTSIWPFNRMYDIYKLPAMKVFNNVIGFLGFLLIFAYMLLFEYRISYIAVVAWMVSFTIDEFLQILGTPRTSRHRGMGIKTFKLYYSSLWNVLDMLSILVFFAGMFQKQRHSVEEYDAVTAVIFVTSFIMMCIRTLNLFCISEYTGPMLVVIKGMVRDTFVFFLIMVLFMFMYSVASFALMYPHSTFNVSTVGQIVQGGLWILFGELNLEETRLSVPDCSFNQTVVESENKSRCPQMIGALLTPFLKAIYGVTAVFMLLNLLVAIYNNTFTRIQEKSRFRWLQLQENFLLEYTMKGIFPVHLQLLAIPFFLLHAIVYLGRLSCCRCLRKTQLCTDEGKGPRFVSVFLFNVEYSHDEEETLKMEMEAAQKLRLAELKTIEDDEMTKIKQEMKRNTEENEKKTVGIISTVTNVRRDLDKIEREVSKVKSELKKEMKTLHFETVQELRKMISTEMEDMKSKTKEIVQSLQDANTQNTSTDMSGVIRCIKALDTKVESKLQELERFFGKHTIFKKFAQAEGGDTES